MPRSQAQHHRKAAALDSQLRTMFQRLESRALPDRFIDVVDQLEAAERPALRKAG